MVKQFLEDMKKEFSNYNRKGFTKDILAGITVAAVALPLALAFGVSSGTTAAAGLITAIIAGIVIGALSGASYQISGPTGAMTAILISLVAQYKIEGVFIACFISGIILILAGAFKFGRLVSIIPMPVITGFTTGISVIIALGQIDNFFGVKAVGTSAISKVGSYFTNGFHFDGNTLLLGMIAIAIMIFVPKKLTKIIPSSLIAIVFVLILNAFLKLPVAVVGDIPKTLLLSVRLKPDALSLTAVSNLIVPAISIAALGMIESLLCGASAGRMKGEKMNGNRELFAQGIGNMIIPFFGGIPATAAIARTSVAVKSGGKTRLTGIFHAVILIFSMFILNPIMSGIPLSVLAAVLMVTAFKMNEWHSIRYIFSHKFKGAMLKYSLTLIATVVFDLTIAIVVGVILSAIIYVVKSSDIEVSVATIDEEKLIEKGIEVKSQVKNQNLLLQLLTANL